MFIMHLFVSYAQVNLCHFFSQRVQVCIFYFQNHDIAQNNRAKLHHTLQYRPIRKQSVHWVPAGLNHDIAKYQVGGVWNFLFGFI